MKSSFQSFILEGGNVRVTDIHGQEVGADKINLEKVSRTKIRGRFLELFKKLNADFKKHTGESIWKDESIITSGHVFNGSSEAFFQSHISDEEYAGVKKMVGDIDVTVPEELKKQVWDWLNGIKGHKLTNHITYVGNNKPTYQERNAQINALFNYQEDGVNLNLQIDFEFLPYDVQKNIPMAFSKFSHSSDWKDLKAGLKGVHHKYLLRALAGGASLRKDIQVITKKTGKPQANPDGVTFNKFSVDRGLRTGAYVPAMDDGGNHKQVNGMPAYHEVPTAQSTYTQDVGVIARHMLGDAVTDAEVKSEMNSFLGIIDLMKKYSTRDQITATLDRMADLYWGHGAQGFERNDPEGDLKIKTAGWTVLMREFSFYKRDVTHMITDYYNKYRMTEIVESMNMKSFQTFIEENAQADALSNHASTLSDKALTSDSKADHKAAAKAHRDGAARHAHHARNAVHEGVSSFDAFLAERDNSTVSVKKEKYSWGRLVKVTRGSSYGTVLHPKDQQSLHMMQDGQRHSIRDEQNHLWHAHREGDVIHMKHAHQGYHLSFDRKHITPE